MLEKVAIVVLHYQNPDDTIECLHSLSTLTYPHYEILLIDNASEPHTIQEQFPNLFVHRNEQNLGFAEGNNIGIAIGLARNADYILLLNNDTTVDPGLLDAFISAARSHPQAGVFGAKIFYYDEPTVLWHTGGSVHPKTHRCFHYANEKWQQATPIDYACGCALFIKREVIEKVGKLSPDYFLIWEEIDWCYRIRKAGFQCLFIPEAKLWHKISRAFDGGNRGPLWQYYYFRNRLLFLKHHLPLKKRFSFYLTSLIPEITEMAFKARKSPRHRFALKGVRDFFLNRLGKFQP